ncbi:trigger factor [Desulfobacterota bacterium AH_259_B03_O07]|nr:trigger factor [Desulfobacterota bacterium AH_259_B03_O07]
MKINVETLSNTERKLDIIIQPEQVKDKLEQVYKEFQRNAKVKGFRTGKVPRKVVESIYARQIFDEVTSRLVSDSFESALEEASVTPVSRPELTTDKVEAGKEFHYSAVFEVIPDFEVDNYSGIELTKEKYELKDEDVDKALNQLRERSAEAKPLEKEREARNGDYVVIDYEGTIEGKSLKDLKRSDVRFVIGEGQLIPQFEDNILGMKKGEENEFEVTYAEDFQIEEAAGKTVNFTLKLKDILEKVLPELGDEFAKDLGEESLESLRRKIRDDLGMRLEDISKNKLKQDLINNLVKTKIFDVPQSLLEENVMRLKREYAFNFQRQGLPALQFDEKADEKFREGAIQNVKASIILGAIAEKEGIHISNEDVTKRLLEISKSYNVPLDKVKEIYEKNNMIEGLRAGLVEGKVTEFLLEKANIQEVLGEENQIDIGSQYLYNK